MSGTFDRKLRRLLEEAECEFVRHGKGSHSIWYSPLTDRNFVVPHGIVSRLLPTLF